MFAMSVRAAAGSFFCATQDVAIDSLAVSTLRPDERATGNGFMFGGQYLGIGLGGGGALFVSGFWGFNASLIYVSSLMLINLAFGVMSRAAPQLNIFAVGFPVMLAAGFVVILMSLPTLTGHVTHLLQDAFELMGLLAIPGGAG